MAKNLCTHHMCRKFRESCKSVIVLSMCVKQSSVEILCMCRVLTISNQFCSQHRMKAEVTTHPAVGTDIDLSHLGSELPHGVIAIQSLTISQILGYHLRHVKSHHIQQVDNFKLLDVIISPDLSWHSHTNKLCSCTKKIIGSSTEGWLCFLKLPIQVLSATYLELLMLHLGPAPSCSHPIP